MAPTHEADQINQRNILLFPTHILMRWSDCFISKWIKNIHVKFGRMDRRCRSQSQKIIELMEGALGKKPIIKLRNSYLRTQ